MVVGDLSVSGNVNKPLRSLTEPLQVVELAVDVADDIERAGEQGSNERRRRH